MNASKYKAFIFDLDNTLYPEKDYLYQVYYLIGIYLEDQEKLDAKKVTEFLVYQFENVGRDRLFDKLIEKYSLDTKYLEVFLTLLRSSKIPLKLYLYQEVVDFIGGLPPDGLLFIVTNGHPQQQLNKMKHIEWLGLDQRFKLYLANEFRPKPAPDAVLELLTTYNIDKKDAIFIGDSKVDEYCAKAAGIDFYDVARILK